VLTENTQKEGDSEAVVGRRTWTADSGPVASNSERARASAQKQTKKEGNILIFETMLSATGAYCCRMVAARVGCRRRKVEGERGQEEGMGEKEWL
jgi:hypothetical protein